MIDDDVLATAVRDALDSVEVPEHGAEQVLAARHAVGRSGRPDQDAELRGGPGAGERDPVDDPPEDGPAAPAHPASSRRLLAGVAAALVVVVAVGVAVDRGGGGAPPTASKSSTAGRPFVPSGVPFSTAPVAGPGQLTNQNSAKHLASGTQSLGPAPGPVPAGPSPTKVVQTGGLTLAVARDRLDSTVGALTTRATGSGGSVAKSQTFESATDPYADVTLQVPTAGFDRLLADVRHLGAPSAVTTSATDVTGTSVDLAARLAALEATRQQFLAVLAKAQTISDILAVQAQITPVQTQIEQLQGQQQVLDNQTAYATLAVHVTVPTAGRPSPRPPSGLARAWAHARHAFTSGLDSVVAALGGIAVFLIVVAVLAAAARLSWVVVRRRLV